MRYPYAMHIKWGVFDLPERERWRDNADPAGALMTEKQPEYIITTETVCKGCDLCNEHGRLNCEIMVAIRQSHLTPVSELTPVDKMGKLIELFHDHSGNKCFSIYCQDTGMGEHDYCALLNGDFLFRAGHHKIARNIVMAIRNTLSTEDLTI
jgi:hypothetical protein